jgi:hypothetical protein
VCSGSDPWSGRIVVAGLFLLLFAWAVNRVLRMAHDQITQLPGKAAAWVKLAARDWSDYVANRAASR